jgi:hypothetical protein
MFDVEQSTVKLETANPTRHDLLTNVCVQASTMTKQQKQMINRAFTPIT